MKKNMRYNERQKKMKKETLKNKYLRSISSKVDAQRTCTLTEKGLQKAVKIVFHRKIQFENREATDFLTDFSKIGVADKLSSCWMQQKWKKTEDKGSMQPRMCMYFLRTTSFIMHLAFSWCCMHQHFAKQSISRL